MGSDHLLIGGRLEPRAKGRKETTQLSSCWKHPMRMLLLERDLVPEIIPWLCIHLTKS